MNPNDDRQKACIDYPCRWVYKVIGADEAKIRAAIAAVITCTCDITVSRSSASGKYLSLNVSVQIEDEAQRLSFYEALCRHPSVKMVL